MRSCLLAVLLSLVSSGAGAAPKKDAKARGKELTQQAKAAFQAGQYDDAGRLYLEAYDVAQSGGLGEKPELLFNAALAYEKSGRCDRVADLLGRYAKKRPSPEIDARLEKAIRCAPLVLVSSEPSDAEVWIDGEQRGKTPLELRLLAGAHRLELRREGFAPVEVSLTVDPGVPRNVSLRLEPLRTTGVVAFEIPEGTTVQVDDVALGTGPLSRTLELAEGAHRIRATAPWCPTLDTTLEVKASAEPVPHRIEIPGCEVRVETTPPPAGDPYDSLAIASGSVAAAGVVATIVLGVLAKRAVNRRQGEIEKPEGMREIGRLKDAESDARNLAIGANVTGAVAIAGLASMVLFLVLHEPEGTAEPGGPRITVDPASMQLSVGWSL